MKIRYVFVSACAVLFSSGFSVFADSSLNREQFFSSYVEIVTKNMTVPETYKNMSLKYKGIAKDTPMYQTMQKAVYYELFPNGRITLPLNKNVTEDQVCVVVKRKFAIDASCEQGKGATLGRLNNVFLQVQNIQRNGLTTQVKLTDDGYLDETSLNHISDALNATIGDSKNISEKYKIYNTIQSMVDGAKDPYTVFFPPTEAEQFNEELEGEFEGIGAYVEMNIPGQFIITSPIDGSPAQEAGLLAGDRVLKIDGHRVTPKTDITTAVDWIKGPAGTQVKLLILRGKSISTYVLTRAAVTIKNVSAKTYSGNVCYMSIGMFGYGVSDEFTTALKGVFGEDKCKKYVFDVRNNPGGSLEEVSAILGYFVPTGKATVVIDSKLGEESLTALDVNGKKLTNKNVAVLMNQGSASASEIFAGTIRDYLPYATLIGDTSYGKGSVQELLQYPDGSMLKYTVAKRYTGKSKTTIDHIGIKPDIQISDNPKTTVDEQLQAALK